MRTSAGQAAEDRIRLIIQADDYGACPAISDGILRCFQAGVVTQASVIVPAPDAPRAMRAALASGLPLGAHLALLCEWQGLRWSPLTAAPSLRAQDGAFFDDLEQLRARAEIGEAEDELRAQLRAAESAGVRLTHMESHVRVFDTPLLTRLSAESGLPCRDPVPAPGISMELDSLWHLSVQDLHSKPEALAGHLASLRPGLHMIVTHPAEDRPELRNLCSPSSRRWKWARDIRVSDMAALMSPDIRRLYAARNIELVSLPALSHRISPLPTDAVRGLPPGEVRAAQGGPC
jgi:hypothetical protein